MVKIPKMSWKDLGIDTSDEIFPAWKLSNGKELDAIYLGKYKGDENACAVKGSTPMRSTIDTANTLCVNKGAGWHCATRLEYMAAVLWSAKHNCQPAYSETNYTTSGAGDVTTSHNGQENGIYDLSSYYDDEWNIGVRLVYGELQVVSKDGVTFGNDACFEDSTSSSPYWYAIDGTTGNLIKPNGSGSTANSIKCSYESMGWGLTGSLEIIVRIFYLKTDPAICEKTKNMLIALGFVLPEGVVPKYNEMCYLSDNDAEAVGSGGNCGVFESSLCDDRSFQTLFRPAFCTL